MTLRQSIAIGWLKDLRDCPGNGRGISPNMARPCDIDSGYVQRDGTLSEMERPPQDPCIEAWNSPRDQLSV
jgi:hypothetical protein